MKKYMKIFTIILLATVTTCFNILEVSAGSVDLSFKGNDTVKVGQTITLTVSSHDITGLTDGLATCQGDIIFDENYLEYVSFQEASKDLSVSYGTKTKRFVALGIGGEYVADQDDLFTITFKAKQIGQTTLNIEEVVIGDTKAIIHSANVNQKVINIVGEDEQTPPPTTPTQKPSTTTPPKKTNKKPATNSTKSSDNSLKSLTVNNAKMSPAFQKDVLTYNVTIGSNVNKLDLKYITNDSKATVQVEGNSNFKDGTENIVKVIVTAEDGTSQTYTLKVTKSEDVVSNRLILLNVKEGSLKEEFNSDTYEYHITVPKRFSKLTIDAIPEQKDSKVEIIGNRNLSSNGGIILIKLTDKNGYNSYYRLNVKKAGIGTFFGMDIKYLVVIFLILFLLLLLWFVLIPLFKRKKEEDKVEEELMYKDFEEEKEYEDPLYDDEVTKDELVLAIQKKNPKLLKMLLTQEKVNKLKDELKSGNDPYDDVVTKEEIIKAIEEKDVKKLRMLLTQEELNQLKDELKNENE